MSNDKSMVFKLDMENTPPRNGYVLCSTVKEVLDKVESIYAVSIKDPAVNALHVYSGKDRTLVYFYDKEAMHNLGYRSSNGTDFFPVNNMSELSGYHAPGAAEAPAVPATEKKETKKTTGVPKGSAKYYYYSVEDL